MESAVIWNFERRAAASAIAAVLAFTGAFAHAADAEPRKPNIVYILTDQWRAQALGYAGDPNVKTPNIDALAARSVNFENAVSVCPVCTPHRASLLTGKYPLSTGMFVNDLYLPSEELTMAEIFGKAGYSTAYIGKWHLDGHGRDTFIPKERRQGFDYWKVLECTHEYNESYYYAGDDPTKRKWDGYDAYAQTADAQEYIRARAKGDAPFLLFMAYGGPHFPHGSAPPELKKLYPPESLKLRPNVPKSQEARARKEAQGYYAHCTALDKCIADLIKTLEETGAMKDTIFVFTSDHGEMLGSQEQPSFEKQRPWDESIRVPLLLTYPALTGGKALTVKAPINTPDILPTLLSLSGIKIPDTIEGEDLSAYAKGGADEDRAALIVSISPFAGYLGGKAYRGIRTSRYTYVRSLDAPWLLYDNETDPYQLTNLIGDPTHSDIQKRLEEMLQEKLKETNDEFLKPADYLKMWNLSVDERGCIPYGPNSPMQTPKRTP